MVSPGVPSVKFKMQEPSYVILGESIGLPVKGAQEPLSLCAHGKEGTKAEPLAWGGWSNSSNYRFLWVLQLHGFLPS